MTVVTQPPHHRTGCLVPILPASASAVLLASAVTAVASASATAARQFRLLPLRQLANDQDRVEDHLGPHFRELKCGADTVLSDDGAIFACNAKLGELSA